MSANQFIQVSGENLVLDGKKIVLRGFGLGNWMNTEHFMTKMPGTDHLKKKLFQEIYGSENAHRFFESYLSNYITETDFNFLKKLGVNVVRLPFTYRHFEDDDHPNEYKMEGFKHLDRILGYCEKYQIHAILDLHAVPGGQNPDSHADNDLGESKFWDDASFRNRVIGLWEFIATHYKDNPWIAAYDLLNEPVYVPDAGVFNDFFDKTIAAIRKVDKHHVLFLEGDHWAQDFSMFHEPQDPQIAYSFHYYPFYSVKPYPEPFDKIDIERHLAPCIEKIREQFHRPIWCGETGAGFSREKIFYARDLVKATLDVLEEHGVSWTLWAYKDAQAMSLVFPKNETPWMRFVTEMHWNHQDEHKFTNRVFDFFEESGQFTTIPEETRLHLRFRIRGALHALYLEQILRPKLQNTSWETIKDLPNSFHWDNCDHYKEIADLVKTYCNVATI